MESPSSSLGDPQNSHAVLSDIYNGAEATTLIWEIEEGDLAPRIEIWRDPEEIQRYFLDILNSARFEILFFFPTIEAFEREESIGVIDALSAGIVRGVNVRIVSPTNEAISQRVKSLEGVGEKRQAKTGDGRGRVDLRMIRTPATENTVSILIVDRRISLILEQKDNGQGVFSQAIGLATFYPSEPSVAAHRMFFETLWQETELRMNERSAREEEARARRQSELLQDILTHDIRNYNQVIKLSSELLEEEFMDDENVQDILRNMLEAVNGSTQLLERAKKLRKILSEHTVYLYPMNITEVIQSTLITVRNAHPNRQIDFKFENHLSPREGPSTTVEVVADDLLEEAFANAFSNAVKYTEGDPVHIEITVDPAQDATFVGDLEPSKNGLPAYILISISDHGRGIPEDLKPTVFSRYLKSAKGTGLGMSIIHALIVERYKGKVTIKDRVTNDPSQGTIMELTMRYNQK